MDISKAGTFALGDRTVNRTDYGAMQLAGPVVYGPPKDRNAAIAPSREGRRRWICAQRRDGGGSHGRIAG